MKNIFIVICCLVISGCSNWIHRIDVQQGNVLTQEMVNSLELGMSKRQVKHILGTAPIINSFYPQRWNYIYTYKSGSGKYTEYRFIITFENDKMQKISGDISKLPTSEALKEKVVVVPAQQEKKGFFSRWR